ncbi:TetR/AcrR family transcriptional regulator [Micromonospora mirobrigensis]|uniref:Transcriptional regulator, TetR family n=1 Tax=Micromonospora mirobrigensis TaxID=262898 RepID=A0A1C4ZM13_9ACTN|nr:TetR/AcrR family transcriptional regulator [Micromonospora mirobrigensis]SCF33811.1 transcriptional regulator, TetR family [Micromonospora mirobrigensis]
MPTPERTTTEAVIAAGRAIVEEGGLAALTMQAVAARVGVRAPSLYKRVRDRDELVRRIAEATADELGARLRSAAERAGEDPREALVGLAHELRAFARERPHTYQLIFGPLPSAARPEPDVLASAAAPVLEVTRRLAGDEDALEAARTVTAWANGFLLMEVAQAFRLGGDLDAAYAWGIKRLADAIAR